MFHVRVVFVASLHPVRFEMPGARKQALSMLEAKLGHDERQAASRPAARRRCGLPPSSDTVLIAAPAARGERGSRRFHGCDLLVSHVRHGCGAGALGGLP